MKNISLLNWQKLIPFFLIGFSLCLLSLFLLSPSKGEVEKTISLPSNLPLFQGKEIKLMEKDFEKDINTLEAIILPYLNSYSDEIDVLKKIIVITENGQERELVSEIQKVDLNGDKKEEVVLVYSFLYPSPFQEMTWAILELEDTLYVPISFQVGMGKALIKLLPSQDINGDGNKEAILITENLAINTSYFELKTITSDESGYRNITKIVGDSGHIASDIIKWSDENHDGIKELFIKGGEIGGAKGKFTRGKSIIFGYNGREYEMMGFVPNPSDDIFYLMLDAHHLLEQGANEKSLELIEKAFDNANEFGPFQECGESESSEICALARTQKDEILTYLSILAVLNHLETRDVDIDKINEILQREWRINRFTEGLKELWKVYLSSGDYVMTCMRMEKVIKGEESDDYVLFNIFGYTENLKYKDLCPF